MDEKQRKSSLSAQLFCGALFSLAASIAVFALVYLLGSQVLDKTVYGQTFMKNMTDKQFVSLQSYVKDEKVTAKNLHPLDIWCSRGDKIYLSLYSDNQILYESFVSTKADYDLEEYDIFFENQDQEYTLTFSDGTIVRASLYYYAGDAYYYWNIVISITFSFLTFSLSFIVFLHHKVQYVKQMKSELDILAGGDFDYPITLKGNDELRELAYGIDQMRKSILAHQELEVKMRTANSELVTAMSHDLRTPLTSLLAYLELIERGKFEDNQQLSHFIHRCLEKTLLIKSMADKLFEYFLVYSSDWEESLTELIDADELFQQFCGDYVFSLENSGFQVTYTCSNLRDCLQVNTDLLRRVFDNIYSNILKYADPTMPVEVSYHRVDDTVHFVVSNHIPLWRDRKESTNIGLNTCSRIIQYHKGTFSISEGETDFRITISLPLTNNLHGN